MEHNGDASFEPDCSSPSCDGEQGSAYPPNMKETTVGVFVAGGQLYLESECTMSRRPNRRESSEKAPGPKRKRAAVTQNEKAK